MPAISQNVDILSTGYSFCRRQRQRRQSFSGFLQLMEEQATISDLTLQNAFESNGTGGGAILNKGNLTLNGDTIQNNQT